MEEIGKKIMELGIKCVVMEGELPSGCPWCLFDKFSGANEPCVLSGYHKSCYGYRPDECPLVKK